MSPASDPRQHTCARCIRLFTSQGRLGHHWAAEHAPRTSADIPRTSLVMARDLHRGPGSPRYPRTRGHRAEQAQPQKSL